MKYITALSFAAVLALGASAQALPVQTDLGAMEANASIEVEHVDQAGNPYHHCHGLSAGTSHVACGTLTGGPAGGLF